MNHKEKAKELFLEGYNCAQAVFGAFCDVTGLDIDTAVRLSSSFGGGMGKLREVCGACSGMFMAAGIIFGYDNPDDSTQKANHYALIQKLAEKFRERNNSIICRELLDGIETGKYPIPTGCNSQLYKDKPCLKFVEDAAEIFDELLAERKKVL